jgi:hypothetical protein
MSEERFGDFAFTDLGVREAPDHGHWAAAGISDSGIDDFFYAAATG